MTAIQYLSQIRSIQFRLSSMAAQLECLRAATECITPTYSETPCSQTRNIHKQEDAIIRVLDWEEKMRAEVNRLAEINAVIAAVSNPILQALLVRRYVCGETWEKVAGEISYSLSQTKRLHFSALAEVEVMLNRNEPL